MARATRLTMASLSGVTLAAYTGLQVLGRVGGTTRPERRQRLPGDELVDSATIVTEHAIEPRLPDRLGCPTAPLGGSTSMAKFRHTRSCASAYLIARAREALAICRYRVAACCQSLP
jgi:hypothetical protein